jgi:transcriptional regulator with XRE-family HTH domain
VITNIIGVRIKELRKRLGLSQERLALKAGLDRTYFAGVESGVRNITVKSLEKIIVALETTWSEFFCEMED